MGSGDDEKNDRTARAAADLKATEDLLAGFDRPGRTPRAPPVERDFVDYHLKRERSDPAARPPFRWTRDRPTYLLSRERQRFPSWLLWSALLVGMPATGGFVAYYALADGPKPEAPAPVVTAAPSAATTLSGATAASASPAEADDAVPPPAASDPAPDTPEGATVRGPAAPARSTTPAAASSSAPRVDFIRNL